MIVPYAGVIANQAAALALATNGWLLCNGDEVSATTYAALKALLTTTYGAYTNGSGGSGTSHFRLPDLRGKVIAALDNMGGTSANIINEITNHANADALGGILGDDVHTLTGAQSGTSVHSHGASSSTVVTQALAGSNVQGLTRGAGQNNSNNNVNSTEYINVSIDNSVAADASAAHPNMQPTMFMNYIIKT